MKRRSFLKLVGALLPAAVAARVMPAAAATSPALPPPDGLIPYPTTILLDQRPSRRRRMTQFGEKARADGFRHQPGEKEAVQVTNGVVSWENNL